MDQPGVMGTGNTDSCTPPKITQLGDMEIDYPDSCTLSNMIKPGGMLIHNPGSYMSPTFNQLDDMDILKLGSFMSLTSTQIGDMGIDNPVSSTSLNITQISGMGIQNPSSFPSPTINHRGDMDLLKPGSCMSLTNAQLGDKGPDNPGFCTSLNISQIGSMGTENLGSCTSSTMYCLPDMGVHELDSCMALTKNQLGDVGIYNPGSCISLNMTQFGDMGMRNPGFSTSVVMTHSGGISMENLSSPMSQPTGMVSLNQGVKIMPSRPCMESIPGVSGLNAPPVSACGFECVGDFHATFQQAQAVTNNNTSLLNTRPPYSYIYLITMAIQNSPRKKLSRKEICQFIMDRFPYYRENKNRWSNNVHDCLIGNDCFVNELHERNRIWIWSLHPDAGSMLEKRDSLWRWSKLFRCAKKETGKQYNKDIKPSKSSSFSREDSLHQSPDLQRVMPLNPHISAGNQILSHGGGIDRGGPYLSMQEQSPNVQLGILNSSLMHPHANAGHWTLLPGGAIDSGGPSLSMQDQSPH